MAFEHCAYIGVYVCLALRATTKRGGLPSGFAAGTARRRFDLKVELQAIRLLFDIPAPSTFVKRRHAIQPSVLGKPRDTNRASPDTNIHERRQYPSSPCSCSLRSRRVRVRPWAAFVSWRAAELAGLKQRLDDGPGEA